MSGRRGTAGCPAGEGDAAAAAAPSAARPLQAAGWDARLSLRYRRDGGGRTVGHDLHDGPLRVLRALYPEGPGVCHHVLVHPPGGVAGGDRLALTVEVGAGAHALVTTAGATRFYRSDGPCAAQAARLHVAAGARLEWLPLETLAYPGCRARNAVHAELAPGADLLGWDLLALGLPGAAQPFGGGAGGWFEQTLAVAGVWREHGRIDAGDATLLESPAGWAGRPVAATAWIAGAAAADPAQRARLLDSARQACDGADETLRGHAGATALTARRGDGTAVVVLRLLAPRVEPALRLLGQVRGRWRQLAWGLAADAPRAWLGTAG